MLSTAGTDTFKKKHHIVIRLWNGYLYIKRNFEEKKQKWSMEINATITASKCTDDRNSLTK